MANTVNVGITTSACTFNQWRITDNLMANDVNEIARGDFIKTRGNIELTNGKITLSNSSGGFILDVHDDTNIDGTLTVKDIEVDNTTGHVYVDAGDVWFRRMGSADRFWANSNSTFFASNVSVTNATVGTLNVNNQLTTINTTVYNIANTSLQATMNVHPANTWFFGANVNVQNTGSGSLNVYISIDSCQFW